METGRYLWRLAHDLRLELEVAPGYPVLVLRIQLGSSGRAACTLGHRAITLAPAYEIVNSMLFSSSNLLLLCSLETITNNK